MSVTHSNQVLIFKLKYYCSLRHVDRIVIFYEVILRNFLRNFLCNFLRSSSFRSVIYRKISNYRKSRNRNSWLSRNFELKVDNFPSLRFVQNDCVHIIEWLYTCVMTHDHTRTWHGSKYFTFKSIKEQLLLSVHEFFNDFLVNVSWWDLHPVPCLFCSDSSNLFGLDDRLVQSVRSPLPSSGAGKNIWPVNHCPHVDILGKYYDRMSY